MFVTTISNTEVDIDTPAKVNLFLQVLNKRPDGYHNINSLFQAVSLFDRLHIKVAPNPEVSVNIVNEVDLPLGSDNLISKAYHLMKKEFGLRKGLSVTLEKNIPISAGVGGGSSDGAATILACNLLFNLEISYSQMAALAINVGSDVPFFFSGGQAIVSGRGEIVVDTNFPIDYKMILANADIAASTAASYAALKMDLTKPKAQFKLAKCGTVDELVKSLRPLDNDFEKLQLGLHPELGKIKESLLMSGALFVRMSGSGPTIFGIFKETPKIKVTKNLNRGGWRFYTVEPISLPKQDQFVRGRLRENYRGLGKATGQGEA